MERTASPKLELFRKTAGCLLFLAGVITFMGIITGEIFYPQGYSTAHNEISDLGSTRLPEAAIFQPSATIFNTVMIVAGILVIIGAAFFQRASERRVLSIPLMLLGTGALGVGLFPGNVTGWHPFFAALTFISGGVAVILSSRVSNGPFRHLSICLGVIGLGALFFADVFIPILGNGGTERWVAYPVLFWLTGFGSYLLGQKTALNPEFPEEAEESGATSPESG